MKKYLHPIARVLGFDLLMALLCWLTVANDPSVAIVIIIYIPVLALISLIVGIKHMVKKKWLNASVWMVNVLAGGFIMIGILYLCFEITHRAKNVNYVCYDVKDNRWETDYHNFELEISRHSPFCQIRSFDERYETGGYTASSDYHDGTYMVNPDGSYLLIFKQDTLVLRHDTLYGLANQGVRMKKQ